MTKLTLPQLPYEYDALEPNLSKQIVELHHDKHQASYVNGANLVIDKPIKSRETMRDFSFNYDGAILHEMYWMNMRRPKQGNLPEGEILKAIEKDFGNFDNFQKEFTVAATSVEGSGWAVLWKTDNGLTIGQLEKHNLLGLNGAKPILVCDVWEHSYYLQYQNNRAEYINQWWDLVNWDDVEKRLL